VFRRIPTPGETEVQALVQRLAERIGRSLERQGVLVRMPRTAFSRSIWTRARPWTTRKSAFETDLQTRDIAKADVFEYIEMF
jgi:hypothetical protein